MNDPQPPPSPIIPSARIGLENEDALTSEAISRASFTEQQQLVQHALIHGLLPLALQADKKSFTNRVQQALLPDQAAFTNNVINHIKFEQTTRSQRSPMPWWRFCSVGSAIAAGLAIFVWVISMPVPVASITQTTAAVWQQLPHQLVTNSTIMLNHGLAEFDLQGHGQLIIEGPAELTFISARHARLTRGRIALEVTPAGRGYTIDTPDGQIVDISTHFAVSVDGQGTTEAHVIDGAISARAHQTTETILLAQDDAAQLHDGQVKKLTANPGAFYTTLPPVTATVPSYVRWHLDEGQGTTSKALAHGFTTTNMDLKLHGQQPDHLPTWVKGQHGQALAFSGSGAYAASDFPGIGGTAARTVACWIRMPHDFTTADGFAIVSWGQFTNQQLGAVWQLSLNAIKADGEMGRMRIGTHGGMLVGSTDLRDNQWHHVAIVMYGGVRPNIGTHVLVYVDGELETISRRTLRVIDTNITDQNHGVWIGRNIAYQDDRRTHPQGFLRGQVDDVIIAAAAFSQNDIRNLMAGKTIQ